MSMASNLSMFQALWDMLDVGYGLFGVKSVDWDALYQQYLPHAQSATTEAELFDILARMLSRLQDKHVWLIGSDRAWNCRMGLPCRLAEVDEVVKAWKAPLSATLIHDGYLRAQGIRYTPELTAGLLHPHVGYLRITAFPGDAEQVGVAIDKALEALGWPRAMVVDVRDNRGGSDLGAKTVADRFADHPRLYMSASVRSGRNRDQFSKPVEWWIQPGGPRQFMGPVVLLVNRDTFSAGETFALAMRVLPHVTLVGEPTAGVFSDTADAVLPNGWQLTYSIGVWRDAQDNLWEGRGVTPDVMVGSSTVSLAHGCDEALDWAIEWLLR